MLEHIASSNGGAIITGVLCLLILIGLRQVNDRFKSKLPVPIPGELLVVCCLSVFFFSQQVFNSQYVKCAIFNEIRRWHSKVTAVSP